MTAVISYLYNGARLGLAFAEQSMPSVARHMTFEVKGYIFCCLDLITAVNSGWEVGDKLEEKYRDYYQARDNRLPLIHFLLGGLGLLAASYLCVKGINHALTPKINLNEILKNTFSEDELKNITASWVTPFVHEIIQSLFVTRIVLNLSLAALDSKPYRHLFNAFLQGVTVFKVSQLQWIQFNRTFPNPFQTMEPTIREGGTLEEFQQTVKELQAIFYVRVFSTQTPDLQSLMQSIYTYSSQAFQKSRWYRHWSIRIIAKVFRINYMSRISPQKWSWPEYTSKAAYIAVINAPSHEQPILSHMEAKLLHQCQKWQLQFFKAGKMVDYSEWVGADLFFFAKKN